MTLYVDSSAILKRYLPEHDSALAHDLMTSDSVLATSRISEIEVRRNLAVQLEGTHHIEAKAQFLVDLDNFALMAMDAVLCSSAAHVAERTGIKTLDAIHLASALRAGERTTFLTFDVRQAQAGRSIGLTVVGV